MSRVVFLLFFLSGAAGLVYESIWSRYLGLFVGHGAYAQILVMTIFLGGMSLGATWIGSRSDRIRDPLLGYVVIELVVGVLGFFFHEIFGATTGLAYGSLFPMFEGSPGLALVKWMLAGLLVFPQSVLLGMTFPLMSAALLRMRPGEPGRSVSLLYFSNSLGAAVGVLLAGFVLVAATGLPGTVRTAALLNGLAAIGAFALRRRAPEGLSIETPAGDAGAAAAFAVDRPDPRGDDPWRFLLMVAFGTAVASFLYEIAWIRMLSLVLGSATHSFELMLSAFILGLALGAAWIRRRIDRLSSPVRTLARVQWVMGAAALATLPIYLASFGWMADWLSAFQKTGEGYRAFNLARYSLCLMVMLPSTFCAGMTLPLLTRILVTSGRGERAVGWVYGVNTLGSIVGVVLAGAILLPLIGLKGTIVLGASLDMALGAAILFRVRDKARLRRRAGTAVALGVLLVLLVAFGTSFDRRVLTSGVYRRGIIPSAGSMESLYYHDGRTATVSASRSDTGEVRIATNGKPDASLPREWFEEGLPPVGLRGDDSTQALSGLIAMAHAPGLRNVAVIGQGSGMTSHFVLGVPAVEEAVTIEIEPAMIAGSRVFYPANRRVFDDPRGRFVLDDARSVLAAGGARFDVVLSEPSNPWVSGVAGLFTTEFYARVMGSLTERGVFGQWIHLYEMNDRLVLGVLAAIHENFPDYAIYLLNADDLLIVATRGAELAAPDWTVFDSPGVREDLGRFLPFRTEHFEAMRILDREVLAPLLERWPEVNSDFMPHLDLGGERARYLGQSAEGIRSFAIDRFDLVSSIVGRPRLAGASSSCPVPGHPRLEARAIARRAREIWDSLGRPDVEGDSSWPEQPERAYRLWRLRRIFDSDMPPSDWQRFVGEALGVEASLHAGTANESVAAFHSELLGYLSRREAPPAALAAVNFFVAWARQDFEGLGRSGEALVDELEAGRTWIPVDLLADGVILARLAARDSEGARAFSTRLAPYRRRAATDLRRLLLEAWLREGSLPGAGSSRN